MAKGGAGKGARRRHLVPRSSRSSMPSASAVGKLARRNMAKQARQTKQAQILASRRAGGGESLSPPRALVLVSAGEGAQTEEIAAQIVSQSGNAGSATFTVNRQCFTLVRPTRRVEAVLDAMKVGDVMILAIPADGGLDTRGEEIVDAVCMQGVGSVVGVLTGTETLTEKQRVAARKEWAASLYARFPDHSKFFCLSQDPDCSALLRHLAGITPKKLIWRDQRSYLLSEKYRYEPRATTSPGNATAGTLTVEGYVRGLSLSSERLIHLPGMGDFSVESVVLLPHPRSELRHHGVNPSTSMDVEEVSDRAEGRVLVPQKSMDTMYEAEGDSLAGEQTWPTEQELADVSSARHRRAAKRDGDYQKLWTAELEKEEILDEDADVEEMQDADGQRHACVDDEDDEDDMGMDADEIGDENAARRAYLQERAARDEDARFPDEVDTPIDTPAKVRFARYRGLTSLKSSPWHPRENLPPEYAKVYHFEHWPTVQRQALKEQAEEESEDAVAPVGTYIRLVLCVPAHFVEIYGSSLELFGNSEVDRPLILSSLNTYENRLAVVHFTFSLTAAAMSKELVLRGKTPLVFHMGFRRFVTRPIYSEDNRRSTKHKLERFVQPGRQVVATVYVPAVYGPCPLLAFLPSNEAQAMPSLAGLPVASGALLSVDADRIILKRITLTGAPVRCHKKKAVVRWMFFSPEDVRWFKPVELHTKFGRKGHIREPLGTHGYMKCYFDGTMMQHDTVCMSLYKRAFPKWTGSFSYQG